MAVPPPSPGHGERRGPFPDLPGGGLLRVRRPLRPAGLHAALHLCPAAGRSPLRPRRDGQSGAAALRQRLQGHHRQGGAAPGLRRRSDGEISHRLLRQDRALQDVGNLHPGAQALRAARPEQPHVSAGRRPAGPRSLQPHRLRHAHLHVHRPHRRGLEPGARHRARRHLRLLRRPDRPCDPARHRVHPVAAHDPPLARAGRRNPSDWPPLRIYLCITIILSLYRLDESRPGGARPLPVAAHRGFRHRRAARRRQRAAHHLPPYGALLRQPHHRRGHPRHPQHDPGRDGAELPRPRPAAAHRQLGRAAAGGAEHPRHRHGALALRAGYRRGHRGAGAELRRRRPARRRRPLQPR